MAIPVSRFLLAATSFDAHVFLLAGVARALVARGHHVRFCTGRKHALVVETSGARFEASRRAEPPGVSMPPQGVTLAPGGPCVAQEGLRAPRCCARTWWPGAGVPDGGQDSRPASPGSPEVADLP